jgi:predicted TIM-barrel fold metal-dependent hydrolase
LWSQAPEANARRLDLHHHFITDRAKKRIAESKRQGWDTFQSYSPAKAIEAMDKAGVATAFLSCSTPGVWFGDDFAPEREQAIALARDMNDYAARLRFDYKGRFGHFATLPLPDVDASLREIEYAFDTLHADGVGLLTSYGNHWLGEKMFEPVFDELNRRNAVVYSHPTDAPCCHNLGGNPATVEWLTDTARAIMTMISENPAQVGGGGGRAPTAGQASAATRYANIKFIWSHAGGSLVGVAARVVGNISSENLARPAEPNSRLYHIRRFYYDTAGSANPILMQAIAKLAGAVQIVFGSDFPFGGPAPIVSIVQGLQTCGFSAQELRGIDRENALKILPKYKA